jgi:predicted RNase H-like HicB family nuclease
MGALYTLTPLLPYRLFHRLFLRYTPFPSVEKSLRREGRQNNGRQNDWETRFLQIGKSSGSPATQSPQATHPTLAAVRIRIAAGRNAPLNNLNEFWFNPLGLRSLIMTRSVTMVVEREGDGYVAFCPEIDVATQGDTLAEARANLKEAVELFFETASPAEISDRQHNEVYVGNLEVAIA